MRCTWPALAALLLLACTGKQADPGGEQAQDVAGLEVSRGDLPDRELPAFEEAAVEAPVSLTASDGTGLKLVSVVARAVVEEPLAFTELHLVFENPQDRTIEGQFTIDLPPDSAISRFAMKIGERWQEGEVVERQAARVAYEDFLHRKQDPALLENQAGNRFSARVFPIPANGRKELIVSFSQELRDSSVPYRLHLDGLPKLHHLDVEVHHGETVTKVTKEDQKPQDVEIASRKADQAVGLRHDTLALARVQAAGTMPAAPIEELTILFDTSASRALGFGQQIHRLGHLIEALRRDGSFPLRVVAFDQDVSLIFAGDAKDFGQEELEALYTRRALGASDLAGAVERLVRVGATSSRMLLVSDGIATAGEEETAELAQAAYALKQARVRRLDAIIDGGLQDREVLTSMTTAGLPEDGIVADARLPPRELVDKLTRATLSDMPISVPGATFVWPTTVSGVQPGDEVLVYAELPADAAMKVVLGGEHPIETAVELTSVERPLLERALVSARIEKLSSERSALDLSGLGDDAIKKKIVELSTKHRVLSDFTALLVLETEADYDRFDIDRNALSDILTVDSKGIALMQRHGAVFQVGSGTDATTIGTEQGGPMMEAHFLASPYGGSFAAGDDEDVWGGLTGTEVGEAFGVGGLGLVGTGRGGGGTAEGTIALGEVGLMGKGAGGGSGYGRGSGAGFGGRGTRVPRVRQAKVQVRGAMDKDIIRRIVRAHINEVRHCYTQGLIRDPGLRGRVEIQFTIATTGNVPVAVVRSSTVKNRAVGNCIAKAAKRWRFPRAEGTAVVTYPFVLEPGGGSVTPPKPPPPPTPEELERQRLALEAMEARRRELDQARRREQEEITRTHGSPYSGKMFDVMKLVDAGEYDRALAEALLWQQQSPGDVLALVALGEALEGLGKQAAAARVYGSLIDLFPSRADLRRYAGYRLEGVGTPVARRLAADNYGKAVEQRPDHPNSHRLHAYALLRDGRHDQAFDAIVAGAARDYPTGRFRGVDEILRDDIGLIAAAWIKASPSKADMIRSRVEDAGASVAIAPSTRFVMSWETDANDVDFHIHDGHGGHAYYTYPTLPSGGRLYADVTTGYGPECFTIDGHATAFPYEFEANYYSRGPMGYGMGSLQIVQHDGSGGLLFEERPFVIMKDNADVKLGRLEGPLH